ncbi:uncharacterized abhydrolase domain-containing protein DDB_G0269086 [Rhagoletis pomonella]|uniref:uncharacterized abhydrolase domain-containing protein DDB_G0269086 n=1 Tax=Rhagoletis pomonella TaxID=28610 RepID=UPI0017829320|nr:uncharacterized abhydrolase domain-containing protein DDB_G0269086 [Rhagoletis pomonella]
MNVEKLKRLQTQVRIGGKGTARRKKKVMHQTATTDDKKLQSSLKKLSVSTIPGIEEVNIIKDDLTVIHFNNPKAQASLSANTFAVTGHGETKKIVEMLPEILPQLGQETVVQLRMFANSMAGTKKASGGTAGGGDASVGTNMLYSVEEEDDVPMLVSDFDEVAKLEAAKTTAVATTTTTNSEQPASESDKEKNNTEIKEETVKVLPTFSEEGSNTAAINTATKVNELKSLQNLNLNIKLNEESEQNNLELKSANDEAECRKQQLNLNQENINKTEKEKPTKDARKLNEPQKKNENQQKHESSKQKAKNEPKPQKNLKDNKKSEESALNTNISKQVESETLKIIKEGPKTVQKNVEVDVESEKIPKEQQKPLQQKQLKTGPTSEKQQKKEKQQQQSEQKQASNTQENVDIKENQNKLQQPQGQQTKPAVQGQVGEQKKLSNKQDTQKTQTPGPKPTQQQQKNNQQIKQKNKSGQKKEQNQDLQAKSDNEQREQGETEKQQQVSKPPAAKQQEKASDEESMEQKKGPKEASTETTVIQRKTETPVKGAQQEKNSAASKPVASAKDNEPKQQTRTAPKEKKQDIPKEQKSERQSDASRNKDNLAAVAPEKPTESETPIVDVSIKTVALQSLESTEKLLGIVNEITKELAVEGIKEVNEEDSASKVKLELIPAKECAAGQASNSTAQFPPTTPNTTVTLAVEPVEKLQEEIKPTIVASLTDAVEKLPIKEKSATLLSSELPTSSSNAGAAREVVKENNDKSVPAKELTEEPSPPTLQKTLEEQLDTQSTLVEILESQPGTSMLIKDALSAEEKTEAYSPLRADPLSKQLSMGEVVQEVPVQISPNKITVLQKSPLTDDMKDIPPAELLNTDVVKDAKTDLMASKDDSKSIDQSQASEVKLLTPEALITSENKKVTTPIAGSPKQKVSPPKQTKSPQEIAKQQAKASPVKEAPKASTPPDAKLKLTTKPQPPQQQHSSKGNTKPMSSKSAASTPSAPTTPSTPTTPTKISPEKGVQAQKSTAPNTKIEGTTKKTNSPQNQVDAAAKFKQQQGVAGKAVRPGGGNASIVSGGSKKGNTSPAISKTKANAGVKQQEAFLQDATIASSAEAAQPGAATVAILSPPAVPATENTANSNQSPPST